MPERYHPTPEDRAPEASEFQTTNEEFLSDLVAKMDVPLTPTEQRSGVQAKRDTGRIIADSRPENSESFEETVESLHQALVEGIKNEQWLKVDAGAKEMFQDCLDIYEEIRQDILQKKGDEKLVALAESARLAVNGLKVVYDYYISAETKTEDFVADVQKIYDRLTGIEAQLSRAENREQ